MLTGFIDSIRSLEPDVQIDVITVFPDEDEEEAKRLRVSIIDGRVKLSTTVQHLLRAIGRRFGCHRLGKSRDSFIRSIESSDVVVDLSGDAFSEDYGKAEVMSSIMDILLVKLLRKKIVIYAQSIGPFKNFFIKRLARMSLNRVDVLMVREHISKKYLQDLGVKTEINLVGDAAFLLKPAPPEMTSVALQEEGIDEGRRPMIGISLSQHLFQGAQGQDNQYSQAMVNLINHFRDNMGATVILIPHVSTAGRVMDDYRVSEIILNRLNSPSDVILLKKRYRADQLKAIISLMDMFVGARMHANIAALSTCVPTVAISYSHKTEGIMGLFGQNDWVISGGDLVGDDIIKRSDELWSVRDNIRGQLVSKSSGIKALAWSGIDLTISILNGSDDTRRVQ